MYYLNKYLPKPFQILPQSVFVYSIVHLPAMVASSNNYCKEAWRILLSYEYFFSWLINTAKITI